MDTRNPNCLLKWHPAFFVFCFLAMCGIASAQPMAEPRRESVSPHSVTVKSSPETVEERVRAMEDEIRRQGKLLEELRALVSEQQGVIARLSGSATTKPSDNNEIATAAEATSEVKTNTAAPSQTDTVENRVKKLETQMLKIGGVRFSGDFRLRYDGIFRSAEPNPPAGFAPMTHVQNSRVRYRLRLNFDSDISSKLSFHGQLATGAINNSITNDQDFGQTAHRHLFMIGEAWIDYHPNKNIQILGGRLPSVFADNTRFLFDDDVRFNGFNERFTFPFAKNGLKVSSVELRAGQYFLTHPNVAIVTPGSPLAQAGEVIGSTGRASNLFHQGLLINQKYNDRWSSQFGGDIQIYRNPNQIQLASTASGVALIVQNGLGIVLSAPAPSGNATTTPGGAIYTAEGFKIGRLTYRLDWSGFKTANHSFPLTLHLQAARNLAAGAPERDAWLAAVQIGRITKKGDTAFLYMFTKKGANALISQFTDDDIGAGGVNIRSHGFRFELGLDKNIVFQSLLFIQNQLRNSGDFPSFFVPLNAFTPTQYRVQQQIVFKF